MEDAVRPIGDRLVAEHASGTDHADGRSLVLHRAHLNRRGVGPQQHVGILSDEEGVLHVARRMLGREIERREDVPVVLDLWPLGHGIAQPREDLDDLVLHQRNGVARPRLSGRAGTGHVAHRRSRSRLTLLQFAFQGVYALQSGTFQVVDLLSQFALELGRHGLELLHQRIQLALASQNTDAELLDFSRGAGSESLDPMQQVLNFIGHDVRIFLYLCPCYTSYKMQSYKKSENRRAERGKTFFR